METNYNPYVGLSCAIISSAVADYKRAIKRDDKTGMIEELEEFFYSEYFRILSKGVVKDIDAMIAYLKRKGREGET